MGEESKSESKSKSKFFNLSRRQIFGLFFFALCVFFGVIFIIHHNKQSKSELRDDSTNMNPFRNTLPVTSEGEEEVEVGSGAVLTPDVPPLDIDLLGDETSYFPDKSARELHATFTSFIEQYKEFCINTDNENLISLSDDPENPFFPTGYERMTALNKGGFDCFEMEYPDDMRNIRQLYRIDAFYLCILKVYLEKDFPELGGSHIELFTPEDFLILTESDGDYTTWGLPFDEGIVEIVREKSHEAHNMDYKENLCKYYINDPGLRDRNHTYINNCTNEEEIAGHSRYSRYCMVYDEDEETINVEETQDSLCSKYQENPDMFTQVITKIEQCNDDEYSDPAVDYRCDSDRVIEIEWTPDLCSVESEENP